MEPQRKCVVTISRWGKLAKKNSHKTLSIGEGGAIMKTTFAKCCPNPFEECKLKNKNKSRKQEGTFRKWKPWAPT